MALYKFDYYYHDCRYYSGGEEGNGRHVAGTSSSQRGASGTDSDANEANSSWPPRQDLRHALELRLEVCENAYFEQPHAGLVFKLFY